MRANQIQASVPAPVASLPPREPMPTVHFSMAGSVHFSMAIDRGTQPEEDPPRSTPIPARQGAPNPPARASWGDRPGREAGPVAHSATSRARCA